jgi:uncharacterized protein
MWRRILLRIFIILFSIYALGCLLLYFNQESLLFHPKGIPFNKKLSFEIPFEEVSIQADEEVTLNGALFHTGTPRRKLVFFLHGNAGNIENLEGTALFYNNLGYDFFTYDYRGFGKSGGSITSEKQFYTDAQKAYAEMKKRYAEKSIVVVGYSIGSAAAAMLAAANQPSKFVLMAPYYSIGDMAEKKYPLVPAFLVSYKFETFRFLPRINAPVCIFHGTNDGTIPYSSSKRLAGLLKKGDRFIPLENQGHGGIERHKTFTREIARFLRD